MAEIASAFVTIAPSAKGFGSSLNRQVSPGVTSAGQSIGRTFGKMFVLGASVIAAAGIGSFLKGSIEEAREAQKVGAATAQIIKATGGAAKLSAQEIANMANELSLKTGVDDEQIQAGQNLLLTFKNVKNEGDGLGGVFRRATDAGADLAAAGFGSIESNAKTLGKALNDPLKGMTALTRAGVTFTEQQKAQIEKMMESGNILGAQKVILGEVEKQVGGVAAATATSGEKAKVAWDNLKETIGTALLPTLDRLENFFTTKIVPTITTFLGQLKSGKGLGGQVADVFRRVGDVLGYAAGVIGDFIGQMRSGEGVGGKVAAIFAKVGEALRTVMDFIVEHKTAFTRLAVGIAAVTVAMAALNFVLALNPITLIVIGIAALAAGFIYAYRHSDKFREIVDKTFAVIRDQVLPIMKSFADFFVQKIVPVIVDTASSIAHSLKPTLDAIVEVIVSKVLPGVSRLLTKFHEYQPTIQKVVGVVLKLWAGFIKFQVAIIGKVLPVLIRLAAWLIGKLFVAIGTVITQLVAGVRGFISFGKAIVKVVEFAAEFARGVIKKSQQVLDFVKAMPGKIKGFFKNLPGKMVEIGKAIVDGIKSGASAAWGAFLSWLQGKFDALPGWAKKLLHMGSPAKVMIPIGKGIIDGVAAGVERGSAAATEKTGKAVEKLTAKVKEKIAGLRETISGLKGDFASLVEPIKSAFTGDLFSAETAQSFVTGLMGTSSTLSKLKDAFAVLIKGGFNPKFLYDLFASGNAKLIMDLAANPALAAQASGLLGDVNQLSAQLGQSVAGATPDGKAITKKIDKTNAKLDKLIDHVDRAADRTAEALTEPARNARRRAVRA